MKISSTLSIIAIILSLIALSSLNENNITADVIHSDSMSSPVEHHSPPNVVIEQGSGVESASYIIFHDDEGLTYAKNGDTGAIEFSGTNASEVIQNTINALTSGGKIFFKKGTYTTSAAIILDSLENITIAGEGRSAHITTEPGVSWEPLFEIQNSRNIVFTSLKLTYNGTNNAGECLDFDSSNESLVYNNELIIQDQGASIRIDGETTTTRGIIVSNNLIRTNDMGIVIMAKTGGVSEKHIVIGNRILGLEDSHGSIGILLIHTNNEQKIRDVIIIGNSMGTPRSFTTAAIRVNSTVRAIIVNNAIHGVSTAVEFQGNNLYVLFHQNGIVAGSITGTISEIDFFGNLGYITENSGTATVANNGNITHGLNTTPTSVTITPANMTYDGVAINVGAVSINTTDIQAGVYWTNGTAITDDVILVYWSAEV